MRLYTPSLIDLPVGELSVGAHLGAALLVPLQQSFLRQVACRLRALTPREPAKVADREELIVAGRRVPELTGISRTVVSEALEAEASGALEGTVLGALKGRASEASEVVDGSQVSGRTRSLRIAVEAFEVQAARAAVEASEALIAVRGSHRSSRRWNGTVAYRLHCKEIKVKQSTWLHSAIRR